MKYLYAIFFSIFLSAYVYAADVSESSIQGEWKILEVSDEDRRNETYWIFLGGGFVQLIGGGMSSPESYKIKPGIIDLGHTKISVEKFDGIIMEAIKDGVHYKLEKDEVYRKNQ